MGLRYDEIAEIMKIIDNSSCDELIVETDDVKLVVRRNGAAHAPVSERSATPSQPAANSPAAAPSQIAPSQAVRVHKADSAPGQIEITAPMVGTFYRSPSPDAPPFVEAGSTVKKGQPLCLIEVMKLFTTINSEFDGRIMRIGAENGELVEYGRTLFVIEPV